ncbi:MAG: glycosyltransferase [Prevotella sp.]|nr:glycosyltransferase [Prevotella sp.]
MMKISIITVTYNAASVLKRTLDSVKAQSWQQIEHLIIDGASKDETISMAETYKAQCPYEVVILSEPDKGLYDAMNKGLRLATGDYLVFLNAGDTLHAADTLETIVRSAQPLPGVLYGDTAITDEQGNFLHLRRLRPPKKLTWKSFRQGMLVCHQAFYALTDIAKNLPYDPRYHYSADVDWCIRVMKEAQKRQLPLVNTQAILADYQEEGQTTIHHRDSLKERFDVMRRHYGLFSTVIMHVWFVFRQLIK